MAKKRHLEDISRYLRDDPTIINVDRNEIMKLTKVAKSWEFTCSFCFKKFPSAQAMGGHQNAHRNERLEEKRQFVRDPIGYRKRAYLRAMKALPNEVESSGASNPTLDLHAASDMVKHELANINYAPPKILNSQFFLPVADFGEFNDANMNSTKDNNNINGENVSFVVMNFLPPKELSLVESVGVVHAATDAKGKSGCVEFDIGGYGTINLEKLDLSLKL